MDENGTERRAVPRRSKWQLLPYHFDMLQDFFLLGEVKGVWWLIRCFMIQEAQTCLKHALSFTLDLLCLQSLFSSQTIPAFSFLLGRFWDCVESGGGRDGWDVVLHQLQHCHDGLPVRPAAIILLHREQWAHTFPTGLSRREAERPFVF